jgi:uncharacterized membrane protein YbaN (DUF454 family)
MLSAALGIVGVFVPGLPTTVFVLAASYLFARSSPALEAWLEANRWLGPSLRRFRETRGMPRRSKALALVAMWAGLGVSIPALAAVGAAAQFLALSMGVAGTATLLFYVRTTVAHPVAAAGRDGAAAPFRYLTRSSHAGASAHHVQVEILRQSVPQQWLA